MEQEQEGPAALQEQDWVWLLPMEKVPDWYAVKKLCSSKTYA
jgi:chlorite dismutase